MARKAIIILAIVVAISLFSNYILYQQIQSLNQIVEVYKKQNSEMADDLIKNKIDKNRSSTELSINSNTASTPKENRENAKKKKNAKKRYKENVPEASLL